MTTFAAVSNGSYRLIHLFIKLAHTDYKCRLWSQHGSNLDHCG